MAFAQQVIELPLFDIRNFTDQLQPSKQRNKYICPVCGGDDLGIDPKPDPGKPPAYKCFSNECDERQIREVIAPLAAALQQVRQGSSFSRPANLSRQPRKRNDLPVKLPEAAITLAKLLAHATEAPQTHQRLDQEHGEERVTHYRYSKTQWVERIEWDSPHHSKGYEKTFRQWHIAKVGETVPVWKNGKRVGERLTKAGEAVCSKGDQPWNAYRIEEAITAVDSSKSNGLLMVEGEGVVEAVRSLGYSAITLQGSSWGKAEIELLGSRLKAARISLIYLPDHDEPGYRKAQKVLEACTKAGICCLTLKPTRICANLPPKGDVVDMVNLMGQEEFIHRLEAEIHQAVQERLSEQKNHHRQDKQGVKSGYTPTEIAAEMAESYREHLAWNDEAKLWYRYEAEFPGVWSAESDIAIGAVVLAEFESRMGLDYEVRQIEACLKLLKYRLLVKQWEQPKSLIPFRNGVLDPQSGQLLPHAPGYRFTWALPRDHDPLATDWRTIEEWMEEATDGSTKIKNVLLCWLNACLKGRSDLQRFLHLTGAGGTGKGTFIRLAISLVGAKNHHPSSLADWCGNRFEPVNAYKKRLLAFADEDKYTGGLANFKKVTGGDALRGEIKRQQAFDFIFEGMVMLASNYPIFSGDTSSGIYRRLLMVPFNRVIPPGKRKNLDTAFEPELAALTNYVLSIPDDVVTETLRQSADQAPEVIERTWDWRMRQDSVASWLNECVIHDPQAWERVGNNKDDAQTLFGSYYRYCEQSGSRAKGSREFSPALLELCNNEPALNWGIEKKRVAGGFIIRGLRLRRAGDAEQPYCLESLADVGSDPDVGLSVESDVESEPLQQGSYVGCVGLTTLSEIGFDPKIDSDSATVANEKIQKKDTASYTPYTSQAQSASDTLQADSTVQDSLPYTQPRTANLLTREQLKSALQAMAKIDSIELASEFYQQYQKYSQAQQDQLLRAANDELQANFCQWIDAYCGTQTRPVDTVSQE